MKKEMVMIIQWFLQITWQNKLATLSVPQILQNITGPWNPKVWEPLPWKKVILQAVNNCEMEKAAMVKCLGNDTTEFHMVMWINGKYTPFPKLGPPNTFRPTVNWKDIKIWSEQFLWLRNCNNFLQVYLSLAFQQSWAYDLAEAKEMV